MLEKDIEQYLVREVGKLGGKAYKFISPGHAGVPDRVVCLPGGIVAFVELKAPGGKMTVLQMREQERLRQLDCDVWVIYEPGGVDYFISQMRKRIQQQEV